MQLNYLLLLVSSIFPVSLRAADEIRTVYPSKIFTNQDCFEFADSEHRFGRLSVTYKDKSQAFVFGYDLDYEKCLDICLTEGKILILGFNQMVPPNVIRVMAGKSTTTDVWISFEVAAGPNCVYNPLFHNQTVEPYTVTILGFCEDDAGPQFVYNSKNMKNIQEKFAEVQKFGDIYAQLNGQMILETDDPLINWNVIKSRVKGLVVRKSTAGLDREGVLKKLKKEEHEIIWDDSGCDLQMKWNLWLAFTSTILCTVLHCNK